MDALALRLANRIVGNAAGRGRPGNDGHRRHAALRCADAVIALDRRRHGSARSTAAPVRILGSRCACNARQRAALGRDQWRRASAAISRCGRHRRARLPGQLRHLHAGTIRRPRRSRAAHRRCAATQSQPRLDLAGCTRTSPATLRPHIHAQWQIGVIDGPHGAPDFFTPRRHRRRSSPPTGRCTTTPAAPACA